MSISKSIKEAMQKVKRKTLRDKAFFIIAEDRIRAAFYKSTGKDLIIKESK